MVTGSNGRARVGRPRKHDYSHCRDGARIELRDIYGIDDYRVRAARRDALANGLKVSVSEVFVDDPTRESGRAVALSLLFYQPGGSHDPRGALKAPSVTRCPTCCQPLPRAAADDLL